MLPKKAIMGIGALIFGLLTGVLVGAASIPFVPLEQPPVAVGVMAVGVVGVAAYLFTRESLPELVRDGFYGLGAAATLNFIAANIGEPAFAVRVVIAVVIGGVLAGVGFGVGWRWGTSG